MKGGTKFNYFGDRITVIYLGIQKFPVGRAGGRSILSGLAGLSGEILKYKNVFQIIIIIPAYNLEALRHENEKVDSCLLYHFQFKLYLSKMLSESAASNRFLVLNAPMRHRRIFFGRISS